jgi:hypothetical protein
MARQPSFSDSLRPKAGCDPLARHKCYSPQPALVRMHKPQAGCPRVLQKMPGLSACDLSALANVQRQPRPLAGVGCTPGVDSLLRRQLALQLHDLQVGVGRKRSPAASFREARLTIERVRSGTRGRGPQPETLEAVIACPREHCLQQSAAHTTPTVRRRNPHPTDARRVSVLTITQAVR